MSDDPNHNDEFQQEAEAGRTGFFREFWDFLKYNKKWWLLPIFVVMFLLGALVLLTGTSIAPLIYTLF